MAKKIIIAGGGTGGHIFPAIAIANALMKIDPSIQVLFVGAKGKMEMEKVPQAGYAIEGLDIAGFNRSSLMKNIGLPVKLIRSFFQVKNIFARFKPDAVVGVGGYSSFPVLKFAQARGIPSFIHESNSFAGKSNMLLAKKATKIFVATGGMDKFFPASKLQLTGNPVRPSIADIEAQSQPDALGFFDLQPGRKTLLVIGGSLGARSINEAIAARLADLKAKGLQVIWQTGKTDAERWLKMKQEGVWVGDFIARMELAYSAADIVVSRAGAMAIAELCLVQKPVVFVPYPHAAEDHQTANAADLVHQHAALMVSDNDAASKLVQTVIELSQNETLQEQLKNNIGNRGVANADQVIASEILKTLGING